MLYHQRYNSVFFSGLFFALSLPFLVLATDPQNGDFSEPLKSNSSAPGWTFYTWPTGVRPTAVSVEKSGSDAFLHIGVTKKEPWGAVSAPVDLGVYRNGIQVQFEARRSEDFTGNRAWTFLTWNNESRCVGRFDLGTPTLLSLSTNWKSYHVEIPPTEIPEGAVHFSVNLAVQEYQSATGLTGALEFRRIKVTPVDLRETASPNLKIKLAPAATGSWWTLGDPATFTLTNSKLPDNLTAMEGRISDVSGRAIATVSVSRETLAQSGWSWKAPEPGYYEVRFSGLTTNSGSLPLAAEPLTLQAPNGAVSKLSHDRFQFVVFPKRLPDCGHSGQFGFTYVFHPEYVPQMQLVGFDLALLHSVGWGCQFTNLDKALEPEKGTFRWDVIDPHVELLSKAGIEMIANLTYTPVWASPHPEQVNQIDICVRKATAYAPKDMNDYRTFVEKVVERYKDRIHLWEIWNEPNMPGASCYWSDTPANYVKLLQAGYETIKKVQPQSEVWLGGLGARANYHAFYWNILKGGAEPYYDQLSVHGSWNNPTAYRRVEESLHVKPRPIVNSEWHAILCGNFQSGPFPSETELSRRMLNDLFQQLRGGFQRVVLFEPVNLVEIEELDFAVQQRWFVHSSGLFRRRPRIEPRHAALAMATFLHLTGKKAAYVNEYALPNGGGAVQLKTARGELLALWVDTPSSPSKTLSPLVAKDTALCDWESKPLPTNTTEPLLQPGVIYFLCAPSNTGLATLTPAHVLINPKEQQQQALKVPEAPLLTTPLATDKKTIPWTITHNWTWTPTQNTVNKTTPIQAQASVSASNDGVDILVEVTDSSHAQNEATNRLWYGDSLQIGIDCEDNGLVGSNAEFCAALTHDGPVLIKTASAELRGDLPSNWSPAGQPAQYARCTISRTGSQTLYQLHLPWSELYPMAYMPGKALHIGLVVNDNSGNGRTGYLAWGHGIGDDKNPALYGKLIVPAP